MLFRVFPYIFVRLHKGYLESYQKVINTKVLSIISEFFLNIQKIQDSNFDRLTIFLIEISIYCVFGKYKLRCAILHH